MSEGKNEAPLVVGHDSSASLKEARTRRAAEKLKRQQQQQLLGGEDEQRETIDALEVFDLIRKINDPEHQGLTLEQLGVAKYEHISVDDAAGTADILFTPTIPHCSMATLIGLSLRVKLLRSLPSRFKIRVTIEPGKHASEAAVNKQLNDKERVAAALDNDHLRKVLNQCLAKSDEIDDADLANNELLVN